MPEYKVHFARTAELTVNVTADNEDEALERAYDELPPFTANEAGWGSFGRWSADAGDWLPLNEFHRSYSEKKHGKVVEQVGA